MLTREFPPSSGGIGYYVYNLSRNLIKRGHKVTVITRGNTFKTEKKIVDGINVFNVTFFPLYPFHMSLHGFFVNSLLKAIEPELTLIHIHSPLVPPIKTTLPVVTTVHTAMRVDSRYHEVVDPYSLMEKIQSTYFSPYIESKLLNLSTVLTSVSRSVADELREYGIDPMRVRTVWNGVDEKLFFPINTEKKSTQYILYTGVLRARKGLFDLIKCAAIVNKKMPDVQFIICGAGPLSQRLDEQVHKIGLQEQITFTGRVSRQKLIMLYQKATIHVVPSIYEGLPTVLLEAMACGLPVIATAVSGNSEVISSGVNGFLVPPKSPEAMANVILQLLADDGLREKVAKAARKTIENCYTWDKVTDNILSCYETALSYQVTLY